MNASEINKLGMYNVVASVLGQTGAPIAGVPALPAALTELRSRIATVYSLAQTQARQTSGATNDKNRIVADMIETVLAIAGSVRGYANKNALGELASSVTLVPSDFQRSRELERITMAQQVHSAATEVLTHLTDYGVTATDLTALQAKIDAAREALSSPRAVVAARSSATQQLEEEIAAIDELLRGQIDGLVTKLKKTQVDFYNRYQAARVIVDMPGSHEGVLPPPAPTPHAT